LIIPEKIPEPVVVEEPNEDEVKEEVIEEEVIEEEEEE